MAGAAGGANRTGAAAYRTLCRRKRPVEARPARPRIGRGRCRRRGADDARGDRLASQHPARGRGAHLPPPPLPLAFAILRQDGSITLFIDRRKLAPGLERHLGNAVTVMPPEELGPALDALAAEGGRVQVDPATAACWIFNRLEAAGARLHRVADPCLLPKACKNEIEVDGPRAAHRRAGAALTRFLAWLAHKAPTGGLTEIAASDRLEMIRRGGEHFRDLSFPTISGAGANGAVGHYRATPGA